MRDETVRMDNWARTSHQKVRIVFRRVELMTDLLLSSCTSAQSYLNAQSMRSSGIERNELGTIGQRSWRGKFGEDGHKSSEEHTMCSCLGGTLTCSRGRADESQASDSRRSLIPHPSPMVGYLYSMGTPCLNAHK